MDQRIGKANLSSIKIVLKADRKMAGGVTTVSRQNTLDFEDNVNLYFNRR